MRFRATCPTGNWDQYEWRAQWRPVDDDFLGAELQQIDAPRLAIGEIRNPNIEIRNKFEIQNSNEEVVSLFNREST